MLTPRVVQKGAVGENSGTGSITGWNYVDEVRADSFRVGAELLSQGDTLSLVPQANSNTCFSVNKELGERGFSGFFSSLV